MAYNPYAMAYDSEIRVRLQELATKQTLTGSAADGNGGVVMADKTQTSLEICFEAAEDFTLSSGPTDCEMKVIGSDNQDMSDPVTLPLMIKASMKDGAYTAGTKLFAIPLPNDCPRWVKVTMKGNGMKVNAYLHHIPR